MITFARGTKTGLLDASISARDLLLLYWAGTTQDGFRKEN